MQRAYTYTTCVPLNTKVYLNCIGVCCKKLKCSLTTDQSSQKLLELYNGSLYNTNYSFSPTWAAAYDAVWTLAIALNKTIFQLALSNFNLSQNAIQAPIASYYFDTNVSCLLLQNLRDTQFYGASVSMHQQDSI